MARVNWRKTMNYIAWNQNRLTDLITFWNQELGNEFPMSKALFKQNSFDDVNVLNTGSYIAVDENDNITGMIVAKVWQETLAIEADVKQGHIQVLLVSSDHRGKGIGSSLLKRAEESLIKNGANRIQMGGDPFHYFPGIPESNQQTQHWLEHQGYTLGTKVFDLINHTKKNHSFPSDDTVTYDLLKQDDHTRFIAFLHDHFPGGWEYQAIKYFEMGGDGREFVIAKKNTKIIGFCRINDHQSPIIAQNMYWSDIFDQKVGGIGPLGISDDEQKQGYGLTIVKAAMAHLQDRDIKTMIIDWTDHLQFYKKLDFDVWKTYRACSKTL